MLFTEVRGQGAQESPLRDEGQEKILTPQQLGLRPATGRKERKGGWRARSVST